MLLNVYTLVIFSVCVVPKSFQASVQQPRLVAGRIVNDVAYVTKYVAELRCCLGFSFTPVGSSCKREYFLLSVFTIIHRVILEHGYPPSHFST